MSKTAEQLATARAERKIKRNARRAADLLSKKLWKRDPTKTAPLGNELRKRHPFEPSMRGIGAAKGDNGQLSDAQRDEVQARIDRQGKRLNVRAKLERYFKNARPSIRKRRILPIWRNLPR